MAGLPLGPLLSHVDSKLLGSSSRCIWFKLISWATIVDNVEVTFIAMACHWALLCSPGAMLRYHLKRGSSILQVEDHPKRLPRLQALFSSTGQLARLCWACLQCCTSLYKLCSILMRIWPGRVPSKTRTRPPPCMNTCNDRAGGGGEPPPTPSWRGHKWAHDQFYAQIGLRWPRNTYEWN